MKQFKSMMKLTNLNSESLSEKELDNVVAGAEVLCGCGCWYSECGGSSEYWNGTTNAKSGDWSEWPGDQAEWNYAN